MSYLGNGEGTKNFVVNSLGCGQEDYIKTNRTEIQCQGVGWLKTVPNCGPSQDSSEISVLQQLSDYQIPKKG